MNAEKSELLFKPTLVIGIGGLGTDCSTRVKQLYHSRFEGIPYVQFMGIDTDAQTDEENLLLLTRYNPRQILQELDSPDGTYLKKRLEGIDLERATHESLRLPTTIHGGTYGQRLIGLLGFYAHFWGVKRHLEKAIGEIAKSEEDDLNKPAFKVGERDAKLALSPEGATPFRVFIISSLAGGTGGGCFLDLAYLCRYLLRDRGSLLNGVFLMPDVLMTQLRRVSAVASEHFKANTYAALKELDHLMGNPGWNFTYPGDLKISENTPPYDFCYLIDAKDEAGRVFNQGKTVLEKVAQGLFSFIDPATASHIDTWQQNVTALGEEFPGYEGADRTKHADIIRRRWYSSFNAHLFDARIELSPVGGFQAYAASRLAKEAISLYLNRREWTDDEIVRFNQDFLRGYDLESVVKDLAAGIRIPGSTGPVGQDTIFQGATFLEEANRQISHSEAHARLKQQFEERLDQYISSLLRELGQEAAARAINLLSGITQPGSLGHFQAQITEYVGKSVQRAQKEYDQAKTNVDRPKPNRWGGDFGRWLWDRTVTGKRDRKANLNILTSARESLLTKQIEAAAAQIFTLLLTNLSQDMQSELGKYDKRKIILSRTQQLLDQSIKTASQEAGMLYQKAYPQELQEAMTQVVRSKIQLILGGDDLSENELQARITKEVKALLGQVHVDWIDFLTSPYFYEDEKSKAVAGALERVGRLNVPLLSFNRNRLPVDQTESLDIIGVSNPNDQRIPERMRENLITTGEDRTSLVLGFSVRHGLPLSVVYSAEEWQTAYKRLEEVGTLLPLHVIGSGNELPDPIPNS